MLTMTFCGAKGLSIEHKRQLLTVSVLEHMAGRVRLKVKSAYELSGPSDRNLSWFLWHEVTKGISTKMKSQGFQIPLV